ncbi:MAG: L-seryl-tRNA(Sec) selenium transferase [Anaerolineales bacterium]|nr:L-seryl-tRNA(Sec) selenium transferase [Anaerolineales bacterium]
MSLRSLPSVDRMLQPEQVEQYIMQFGRPLTLEAIRVTLDQARISIQEGKSVPTEEALIEEVGQTLESWLAPTLRPVINATGVIIHTNLGRAPLSEEAQLAMQDIAGGYSTLEFNMKSGRRGKREQHCESLILRLTGAEAAFVVNNNAAAMLLALTALAKRKEVVISRSQLIEIGGGFRIPDVMKQSGAKLVEVGTTNRTHLHDFETALTERTALILQAHHSNFKIIGFTTEPTLEELVELGDRHTIPVLHDLGSGALLDTAQFGLGHEPTVQESLQAGASLIGFSGDKLLGGPQAGILVGRKSILDRLRKHPLARAVRPDKLCLAALSATLQHYLKDEALEKIPIWRMIAAPEEAIKDQAKRWRERLDWGEVVPGRSTVGGGSLPEETLPTWLLALAVKKPNAFAKGLREGHSPIIARIEDDRVLLDPRTVLPAQEDDLLETLSKMSGG